MLRFILRVLLFFVFFLPLACTLKAQRPSNGGQGGVIRVQVRFTDGRPAPSGIHIRLESAEGGAEGDLLTVAGGKCEFQQSTSGVFIVRLANSGFKEVSARVELINNPMAYVVLDLIPLKTEEQPKVTITQASLTEPVSVKDLTIPQE